MENENQNTLGQLLKILKGEPEAMPEDEELITLRQLLYYCERDVEKIQISYNFEWDTYDEFWASSPYLDPFLDKKIIELGAMGKDIIRIRIK